MQSQKTEQRDLTSTERFVIGLGLAILTLFTVVLLIVVGWFLWGRYSELVTALGSISRAARNDVVIVIVSWVLLLIISFNATLQVKEILSHRSDDYLRRRADQIAVIVGLVLIIFLFKQPYLDLLFRDKTTSFWFKAILMGGSGASGWLVWYLRELERRGEFFHVFLMTEVIGLCWYARLTAPEEVSRKERPRDARTGGMGSPKAAICLSFRGTEAANQHPFCLGLRR